MLPLTARFRSIISLHQTLACSQDSRPEMCMWLQAARNLLQLEDFSCPFSEPSVASKGVFVG